MARPILTNKHFKSRTVQRLHRYTRDNFWYSCVIGCFFMVALECLAFGSYWLVLALILSAVSYGIVHALEKLLPSALLPYAIGVVYMLFLPPYMVCCIFGGLMGHCVFVPPLRVVSDLLYTPPGRVDCWGYPAGEPVILINPDGNPEMCKIGEYPALEGYYGYRLPSARDLEKIALFEEQVQILENKRKQALSIFEQWDIMWLTDQNGASRPYCYKR